MGKLLAIVGVVLASVALVGSAFANHAWGNYHWSRSSNPFTLQVGNNVSGSWGTYLSTAVNDWAVSDVLDLNLVSGNGSGSTCSPTSGRIEVCNGAYGNNGWLGIAQIWVTKGSHITQATTKVNDTYFASAPYNTSAWKQMVMCQEVGHDFGLDHQDENFNNPNLGTCMDYTNDPSTNQHPNAHDYEELNIIYNSHLDGSSGGGEPCNPHKPNCQGSSGSPRRSRRRAGRTATCTSTSSRTADDASHTSSGRRSVSDPVSETRRAGDAGPSSLWRGETRRR